MKLIVLVVVAPLALTACKVGPFGGNSSTSNSAAAAPEVVPDSVTVNGIVYTRAGSGSPITAPTADATAAAAPAVAPPSTAPSPTGRDDSAGVPSGADSGQPPATAPSGGHGG
jgi:hypothetical protein